MKTIKEVIDFVDGINSIPAQAQNIEDMIIHFMKTYFHEKFEVEKKVIEYYKKHEEFPDDGFEWQKSVHRDYWSNQSKFYTPSSQGTEAHFDWDRVSDITVMKTGDDYNPQFLFKYKYASGYGWTEENCFMIKQVGDKIGIEHFFFG